jgi:RIO-like serine/threonine protein kinase
VSAPWNPEWVARNKRIAMDGLREMERELRDKKARLSQGELLVVSRDYGHRFNNVLEDLRQAGVNIPTMYNNRDVNTEGDEPISGHELLTNIDFALDWIESETSESRARQ